MVDPGGVGNRKSFQCSVGWVLQFRINMEIDPSQTVDNTLIPFCRAGSEMSLFAHCHVRVIDLFAVTGLKLLSFRRLFDSKFYVGLLGAVISSVIEFKLFNE